MNVLHQLIARLRTLMTRRIWQSEMLGDNSPRGRLFAGLRIAALTWIGVRENKLASRAGALSYSSMLGLGPLVAIVVLLSGSILQRTDPDFVVKQLNRALEFIAPQIRQMNAVQQAERANAVAGPEAPDAGTTAATDVEVNPELVRFLNSIIQGSQSKAVGVLGTLALIVIVIQLFTSIENAFNDIWGVHKGRNWLLRIAFYWAAVTLGAVLAFAALTLMSASTFINMVESVPLGSELRQFFILLGPAISMGVLAVMLTLFYKYIPNTSVRWIPAAAGGVLVVFLLQLNNLLAFAYLRNVIVTQSLYGSLGILPILMLGLFVFWLFVLIGGQITYAWQNANFRSSTMAWQDLNFDSRQGIALLVFVVISRRFRACEKAYTTDQIAEMTKIPTQVLNACLERLIRTGLVSMIPPDEGQAAQEYRFQPARPLSRVTLAEFKDLFAGLGAGPAREVLDSLDPVVRDFHARLLTATAKSLGDESIEAAIERLPLGSLDFPDSAETGQVA